MPACRFLGPTDQGMFDFRTDDRPTGEPLTQIIAITGHRPRDLGGYASCDIHRAVRSRMREALVLLKPSKMLVGMALGVDTWGARLALELGIPFTACVAFRGQELMWPNKADREHFDTLLEQAAEVVYVSPGGFSRAKLLKRNEYMVDNCTQLLAVYNGKPDGGTAACVRYALRQGVPIVRIDPERDLHLPIESLEPHRMT